MMIYVAVDVYVVVDVMLRLKCLPMFVCFYDLF